MRGDKRRGEKGIEYKRREEGMEYNIRGNIEEKRMGWDRRE